MVCEYFQVEYCMYLYFSFGLKSGLVAGTIYYTIEEGVWKSSDVTTALYGKMYKTVAPLISEVSKEVPIEVCNFLALAKNC